MPELPEVETVVRQLRPQLVGKTITNPRLNRSDLLRGVSPRRLIRTLRRALISSVERRAKHVVVGLAVGSRLVIQPRMTGTLLIYTRRLTALERRYVVLHVALGNGVSLVYRDVRRLGTISLLDDDAWRIYTERIGPEPLEPSFTSARFAACMGRTRQAIKKALMDQRLLAGIGNIYANESLFSARIDPSRPANELAEHEYRDLYRAFRRILRQAIRAGGTTVRDYRTSTGARGAYQRVLRVYGRGGEPCRRCHTRLVTTHSIDGRATTFCWRCQGMTS